MRKLLWLVLLPLVLLLAPGARANQNAQGWCEVGATVTITSGLSSSTLVQGSFPSCTVTIFVHGGGLATIYSDNLNTPLGNPFTANTNGQWLFYGSNGRYDIQLSGAGITTPITFSDIILTDNSAGSVTYGQTAPTGTCNFGAIYTVNPTGAVYSCANGVWTLVTGGAGGGLADPGANGIVYRSALNTTQVAIAANFPTLNQSTTGNAATATGFATTPTPCVLPMFAYGINAFGNSLCSTPSTGGGSGFPVITAQQVQSGGSIIPSGSGINQANQLASAAGCLPTVLGNVCIDSTNGGITYGTIGSVTASVLWTTTRPASVGLCNVSANLFGATNFVTCPGLTNPMTTLGDIIRGGASGAPTRVPGPTAPAGVPQQLVSIPAGGLATPPAWAPAGITPRQITGTTATDNISSLDCTNNPVYITSVNVAVALPTPTTLGVPQCTLRVGNYTTGTNTTVTITPATLTIGPANCIATSTCGSTFVVSQNQWCTIVPDGTNWDTNCSLSSTSGITPVANGGTGLSSGTSGGIPGYISSSTMASSPALAAGHVVVGGGAGATPTSDPQLDNGNSTPNTLTVASPAGVALTGAATKLVAGPTPPACAGGTAWFMCMTEGTAPTNVSGSDAIYPDSTTHSWMIEPAGNSVAMLLDHTVGSYSVTASSASITSKNIAAAAQFPAGQYILSCDVAVTAVGTSPTLAVTVGWTDATGAARTKTCTTGIVTVSDNPVTQTITSNGSAAITITQTLAVSTATWTTYAAVTRVQ